MTPEQIASIFGDIMIQTNVEKPEVRSIKEITILLNKFPNFKISVLTLIKSNSFAKVSITNAQLHKFLSYILYEAQDKERLVDTDKLLFSIDWDKSEFTFGGVRNG